MATSFYRDLVLERLRERDLQCAQFDRIFSAYNALSESFTHLVAKNGKRAGSDLSTDRNSEDTTALLKSELNDIYKKKAINDQQLIEANKRVMEVENKLSGISAERDAALERIETVNKSLKERENEIKQGKEDHRCLFDEFIALQAAYNSLLEKYKIADDERNDLIMRMKEFKTQQITLINELNENEQQRYLDRIRSFLAEASKPNPELDRRAELLANEENKCFSGYGDVIPDRCNIKFECNDSGEVNDCLFHPKGRTFFSGGSDKKIRMWEFTGNESHSKKAEFSGAGHAITRIDIDPDFRLILGSSNDCSIRIWGIEDQRQKVALTGHSDRATCAKFRNSSNSVVSGSSDRTLKIWDVVNSRCEKTLFAGSMVSDVTCNYLYGPPIVSAHYDKCVRFWDPRSGGLQNTLKLNGKVTSLFVSADGEKLLCSSRDETLTMFDVRSYGTLHIYSAEQYRTSSDFGKCVISPGDNYVAAGSADGHIFIWNLQSTRLEKTLFKGGHENTPILSLAWHSGGHLLMSGDKRKMLCIWK